MNEVANGLRLPSGLEPAGLGDGIRHADKQVAVQSLIRTSVIKRDDVCGAFVLEKRQIHPSHFRCIHDMNAKFVVMNVEFRLDNMARNPTEQGTIQETEPLATSNDKFTHGLRRCSS